MPESAPPSIDDERCVRDQPRQDRMLGSQLDGVQLLDREAQRAALRLDVSNRAFGEAV